MKSNPKYTGLPEIAAIAFTRKRCIIVVDISPSGVASVSLISGFNDDHEPIYLRYDVAKDHYDLYCDKPPDLRIDHECNAHVFLVQEEEQSIVQDKGVRITQEVPISNVDSSSDYLRKYRNVDRVVLRYEDNPCPVIRGEPYWDVPGDGNCLFYSLSLAHFGNLDHFEEIKSNIVNFVLENYPLLPTAMEISLPENFESLHSYVTRITRPREWGDVFEAMAFCHVYKRKLVIIESYTNLHARNGNTIGPNHTVNASLLYGYAQSAEPIIYLRKTLNHYNVWARKPELYDISDRVFTEFQVGEDGRFIDEFQNPVMRNNSQPCEEVDMTYADVPGVAFMVESCTHTDLLNEPYWTVASNAGNSLFLALSLAVKNNLNDAATIRTSIVNFVSTNWNSLPPSMNDVKISKKIKLEIYRESMGKPDMCGNTFEVMAFCHVFQRQVAIIEVQYASEAISKDDYLVILLYGFMHSTEPVIFLRKIGLHYSLWARKPLRLNFVRESFTLFGNEQNYGPGISLIDSCRVMQPSKYVKIIGDGNCGYEALSMALFQNYNLVNLLKKKAFEFIVKNWYNDNECGIIRYVLGKSDDVFSTVDDYVRAADKIQRQCTYAVITAIAHVHDRQIVVIEILSNERATVVLNVGYFHDASPIFLRLQGGHYDLYESRPIGALGLNLSEGALYSYVPDNNLNMIRQAISPAEFGISQDRNVLRVGPSDVSRILVVQDSDCTEPLVQPETENLIAEISDIQKPDGDHFEMEHFSDEEVERENNAIAVPPPPPVPRNRSRGRGIPAPSSEESRSISSDDHVLKLPPALVRARPTLRLDLKSLGRYYMSAYFRANTRFDLILTHSLGRADAECEHCGAIIWPSQLCVKTRTYAHCCDLGKVKLDPVNGPFKKLDMQNADARQIFNLFNGSDPKSKAFHTHILSYNRIFSTVYPSGRFEFLGSTRQSDHVLLVNGKVSYCTHPYQETVKYYTADGVLKEKPNSINHGHLFFLDLDASTVRERITNSTVDCLDVDIVELFERYLRENNRFIAWFQFTAEIHQQEKEKAQRENRQMKEVVLVVNPREKDSGIRKIGDHAYRQAIFGASMVRPVNDFVAAVFTGEVPEYSYDVKFFPRPRNNSENTIPPHVSARTHDTMMFPLIYLHGEDCWGKSPKRKEDPHLTHLEYARYRLARRADSTLLHQGRRLFLQWIINAQIRVEYDRLEYFRLHQLELRMDTYRNLKEFIARRAHEQNKRVGKVLLIPPDFENTTKHRRENYLDFMAILARFGRPTWFVTFTTNSGWTEIKERCKENNCDPRFSPDIVNDVFYEKWLSFQSDLVHHHMLGRVVAWFTVFEAQNRLLMHAHNIYIMDPLDAPVSGDDVDQVISTCIPNPVQQPELYEKVSRFYIHGPCDTSRGSNLQWPCRKSDDGKCRFNYPHQFRDTTNIDGRKPLYRRPREFTISKFRNGSNIQVDNRWIVPYNPVMTLRYDCHIDFEYLPKACAVRYVTKYCTKGAHSESVHITEKNSRSPTSEYFDWDEITAYKEMRMLGAPEASFRLAGHPLAQKSVGVQKLCVHLEDEQTITFQELNLNADLAIRETPLTAYFHLMSENPSKRHLHYPEVVAQHTFVLKDKVHVWQPTKTPRRTIGRLCTVEPSAQTMERFYLRMILSNRSGITSFSAARTVNGILHPTYNSACIALGLLDDDSEIFLCMEELAELCSPYHLRRAFVTILVFRSSKQPLALWVAFADAMAADFAFRINVDRTSAIKLALAEIQILLEDNGVTLDRFSLPDPRTFVLDDSYPDVVPEFANSSLGPGRAALDNPSTESRDGNLNKFADEILSVNLNTEQLAFVTDVFHALNNPSAQNRLFFLCAAGGTGKTTLLRFISAKLHKDNRPFRAVAYTGVAATLLFDGRTSHRCFGIPLQKEPLHTTTSSLRLQSKEALDLIPIELVIWDEVSMVTAWQLELVSDLLSRLKDDRRPFGGSVVILSGDLRQLLPVVPGASITELLEMSIVASTLWNQFHAVSLKVNMRTGPEQIQYSNWTLEIGEGRLLTKNHLSNYNQNVPNQYILSNLDELKKFVFQDFSDMEERSSLILTPTNVGADRLNREALEMFNPQEHSRIYFSSTSVMKNKRFDNLQNVEDQQFIESLSTGGLPHHELHLKLGVPVLLMRNLNVQLGLCNGTRLIVVQLHQYSVVCRISSGLFKGSLHHIPRIAFHTTAFGLSGTLRRIQYPLKLAFAITISKSQGQTLDGRCGVYLDKPPFAHAMLYVALSRVTSGDNMRIVMENSLLQGTKNRGAGGNRSKKFLEWFTQNIVYKEILRHIPGFQETP